VIGVANTMDLPERLLPRIASRLGSRSAPSPPRPPSLPVSHCPLLPAQMQLAVTGFGRQLVQLGCSSDCSDRPNAHCPVGHRWLQSTATSAGLHDPSRRADNDADGCAVMLTIK